MKYEYEIKMQKMKYYIEYFLWRLQTPPLLIISEFLWILLSGWIYLIYYLSTIVIFVFTIILIPFVPALFKIAIFSFDPIRYKTDWNTHGLFTSWKSPFVLFANIIWVLLFGWELFLLHIISAIVQAITIFGIGNAIKNIEISIVALIPFGRTIVEMEPPIRPIRPIRRRRRKDEVPGYSGFDKY